MRVLRTPDERFEDLVGYPWAPHYVEVDDPDGGTLRMHYVDEGPATHLSSCCCTASRPGPTNERTEPAMPTTDFLPDEATLEALGELPDDEPVVMLNLLEYADDGGESYAKYGRIAWPQIEKRGGSILYSGAPLLADPTAGHWDRVILVQYPTRAAFLDMMADPDYRTGIPHRVAGLKRTVLYAFTRAPAGPPLESVKTQPGEEIFVLNLLRFKPEGGREEYQKYGDVVLPMILDRGGAPVLMLDAQLPLVSEETWDDLYLVRYPTLGTLQAMVATEAWQTANRDRVHGLDLTWAFPTRP